MSRLRGSDRCGLHHSEAGTLYPSCWLGEPVNRVMVEFYCRPEAYVGKPAGSSKKPPEPSARGLFRHLSVWGDSYGMEPAFHRSGIVYDMAAHYGARRPRCGSVLAVVDSMLRAAQDVRADRRNRRVEPFHLPTYATMPRLTLRKGWEKTVTANGGPDSASVPDGFSAEIAEGVELTWVPADPEDEPWSTALLTARGKDHDLTAPELRRLSEEALRAARAIEDEIAVRTGGAA